MTFCNFSVFLILFLKKTEKTHTHSLTYGSMLGNMIIKHTSQTRYFVRRQRKTNSGKDAAEDDNTHTHTEDGKAQDSKMERVFPTAVKALRR